MKISISKELYSRNTLLKTCYKFTDDFYIHLSSNRDRYEIDIGNMLAYPLFPEKNSNDNILCAGVTSVNNLEDIENLSFMVQPTINESASTLSSDDIIYEKMINIKDYINNQND